MPITRQRTLVFLLTLTFAVSVAACDTSGWDYPNAEDFKNLPVPTATDPPVPDLAVDAYLRDNFGSAPWYPLVESVRDAVPVDVVITTTISPEDASTQTAVAEEICGAALGAPGVIRVSVWSSNGPMIAGCERDPADAAAESGTE